MPAVVLFALLASVPNAKYFRSVSFQSSFVTGANDMNPLEAQLDYLLGEFLPKAGSVHMVAPGVLWLRMGLPFALNHVNLWLLEDTVDTEHGARAGWTVIDCGIADAPTRAAWEAIFADHLRGLPIVRVLCTHFHPDHVGLADWLCQRWQAPLWMTAGEYAFARMTSAALPGVDGTSMLPHFEHHGLTDPALLLQLGERKAYYPTLVPAVPESYVRVQDGQTVRIGDHDWRIITGFGHSPEHAALHCEALDVLISGDMVLPRISTNVSVFAVEPEANPVKTYLDSLQKFASLPQVTLVLPSHGKPFRGLQTRITQLADHHAARLAEVLAACSTPQCAATIVPIMFARALDPHQLTFALGEALAHLHKLWYDGLLDRWRNASGVIHFQTRQAKGMAPY
ncbi:MAG: MBL fold metallo-hydrolase [Burkholderiaceae bacterium]